MIDAELLELRRVCAHEASHVTAAYRLGGRVGAVSVEGTKRWAGVALVAARRADLAGVDPGLPLAAWPARPRRFFEHQVMILLAGSAGEELAELRSPEGGYSREYSIPPSQPARAVPAVTAAEAAFLEADGNSDEPPRPSDFQRAWEIAEVLAGAQAALWLEFMWGQVREQLLGLWRPQILRVAAELQSHRTLGAAAVRRLLRAAPSGCSWRLA